MTRARDRVLVTGGAGFIGSNLADRLATEGHDVLVFDSLARRGVAENLDWLRQRHPRRIGAIDRRHPRRGRGRRGGGAVPRRCSTWPPRSR